MNAAHWHLVLNHIPVIGIAFGMLFLLFGLMKKSDLLIKSALWVFLGIALISVPTYLTGDPAKEIIEHLPGVSEQLIEDHEEAAGAAFIAAIVLGMLSVVGLAIYRSKAGIRRLAALLVLVCAVVVAILMGGTANLGGKIRHPEIRQDFTGAVELPADTVTHAPSQEMETSDDDN